MPRSIACHFPTGGVLQQHVLDLVCAVMNLEDHVGFLGKEIGHAVNPLRRPRIPLMGPRGLEPEHSEVLRAQRRLGGIGEEPLGQRMGIELPER